MTQLEFIFVHETSWNKFLWVFCNMHYPGHVLISTEDHFLPYSLSVDSFSFFIVSHFQCASKINGGQFSSSKGYPDEVLRFVRSHPLMFQPVQPVHRRPILLDTDGGRKLTEIAVDRVEAEDGHYNVLFIGTGIVICPHIKQNYDTFTSNRWCLLQQ